MTDQATSSRHSIALAAEIISAFVINNSVSTAERTVTQNLTLQYDKVLFLLEPNEITRPLSRQCVTVIDYPNGRLSIRHKGVDLPHRTFDRLQKVDQAIIVENKRLSDVLAFVAERQRERIETRSAKAPRRRGQAERHMFKLN